MSTGTQTCDIVIPGYSLAERIGSGGYAEVWRAEAPGGIEKAVKIVHGYYDDEFASQELKALERIKGVRHPFLLSLERFEIVNGRLAILTELADMSLDQRLRQCRAEGKPGIPRDELLQYMADAAEALDFLSQRHSLLHLDIKPENLLILGDHIKVADFGLVKELATRTQNSLVSGMTPTYAAPEMFDDEPSAQSDQYSLAIVFQEMLVGVLPFPGRTAAQLAKQHTQTEPQLASLPSTDRPIIARALAKKPGDRYPNCRAFVDALLRRVERAPAATPIEVPHPAPAVPQPSSPSPDDTKPPSFCTTIRRPQAQDQESRAVNVTQPVGRKAPATHPPEVVEPPIENLIPEEIDDVAVPEVNTALRAEQPTLYLAAGGVGIQLLCRLRAQTAPLDGSHDARTGYESLAFDTDRDELREATSSRSKSPLSSEDILHLPLRLPKSYDNAREILGWVSRRWLYNIPRSLETRGYRPLGRVALVDHFLRVRDLIDRKLERLAKQAGLADEAGNPRDTKIKVVILSGTGGGTGAGMAIDLANAVRSLAARRNLSIEVHGCFICTCFATSNSSPLVAANTYSLLAELNHATTLGNEGSGERGPHAQLFESRERPFDLVYWMPAKPRTAETSAEDALWTVASYLALGELPDIRAALRSCRESQTEREKSSASSFSIRKLGYASLADQKRVFLAGMARKLTDAVKRHWLAKDASANWERLVRDEQQAANAAKTEPSAVDPVAAPPPAPPANDATPLALRGRFKEHMSLEFTSEVLLQIQRQLESRDERGRPVLLPRDAKLIADSARAVIATFAERTDASTSGQSCQIAASPILRPLIAAASRRVVGYALDKFDFTMADRGQHADLIDEILPAQCLALLEESLGRPEVATAIASITDLETAASNSLESASTDLLQCGSDRRTLVFVPKHATSDSAVTEKLRAKRPLAAVIPADVDEVLVVCEEAGVSPRSLALGLERIYPGITDAARRLFTRIDVEWRGLF